ncbi:hypothetical protein K2173_009985 [Erythroxylum novogranatense]|uniref:Membrane-associated kinase regulator 4 n=1 Tax=Erythroxylum novogranatense TaxID=1862640 RepID=A0AAV8T1A3_9ROSI|nr:hypothetical protein K2173_009985 [Erythroxylum novogranatense]
MALNLQLYDHAEEEYIDMEVSSYSNFMCRSISSPPHQREFEFQMSSNSLEKQYSTTSPADELFYKGKLLPLHLPPRLQMVEKLLESSNYGYNERKDAYEEFYGTPSMTTAATPTTRSTPFESCNVSPAESCHVSRELNPEEYFFEYNSTESSDFTGENTKKPWSRKLNIIKQSSSIGSKLKASRAYLKSLFGRSGCSADSCAAATKVADEGTVSRAKESMNRHVKAGKKNPFGQIQREKYQLSTNASQKLSKETEDGSGRLHRRSFSMSIKRHSITKLSLSSSSSGSSSSSSSSSTNSIRSTELPFLKRSSSTNSEIENPIQGAIAHCKQSQQLSQARKTASELGFYSFSTSKIENQERSVLCRG